MEKDEGLAKYRQYTNAKMLECIEDARKIVDKVFGSGNPHTDRIAIILIATQLFDKRVSPFYYWRIRKYE